MANELIVVEGGHAYLPDQIINNIIEMERDLKAMREAEQAMKEKLLAEMESVGMVKFQTEDRKLLISYVEETDREDFDRKAFRNDFPELYDIYVKLTKVKPQVKVIVR